MKTITKQRISVVTGTTGDEFQTKLNAEYDRLALEGISYKTEFNMAVGFCAYVTYVYTERIAETKADRLALMDKYFCCGDCPNYNKSERSCPYIKFGNRSAKICGLNEMTKACERFYDMIDEEGNLKQCVQN